MKLIIQRVKYASVSIEKKMYTKINKGILIFLGISREDTKNDVQYLVKKTINLRIFQDNNNKMNLSIKDLQLSILLISQFTLYASCNKGNRPSFIHTAKPDLSKPLYDFFFKEINKYNLNIKTGKFGAMMDIKSINDGPVTIILES